jgi:hypothetical protein
MVEHVRMNLGCVSRIKRDAHEVGCGRTQESVHSTEGIALENADPIAGLESEGVEEVCHAKAALPRLAKRQPIIARDDRFVVSVE